MLIMNIEIKNQLNLQFSFLNSNVSYYNTANSMVYYIDNIVFSHFLLYYLLLDWS